MHDDEKIKKIIQNTKLKFFRRDFEFTLFGIMSYKYNWNIKELEDDIQGLVYLSKSNEVENDEIIINSKFLKKDNYTHDHLIGVIIHEFLHIFHKHGKFKNKDKELWNLACDHIIDRDCKKMKVKFFENQFNIIDELNYISPNCDVYEAYDWLLNNKNNFSIEKNKDSANIKNLIDGQNFIVKNIPGDLNNNNEVENNILNQKIDQIINNSRLINDLIESKNIGNDSEVRKFLKKILKVKINWEELLEKAIKTNTILKPNNRSWKKLNYYYLPHNITLPGYSMEEENDDVGLLIILIDVSGSIKVKELNMFSSVTYKSLKYFSKVLILVHNINIIQTITFEKDEFIKYMDFINNIGFLKGGGTSHYDCYEYIQKEIWNDKELKDKFSMVISLTDGFSDINSCLNNRNFTWMKSVPTTFIISSKKKFENKELNTNSILINPDE